ncbi:hypothetical protein LRS13_00645 [Svornostia abyssi]|uniref:Uncharacterized protein n=1 Tax=Svornostia abyssi TaxID=2898438 RepID=A0ABY5PPL7_9ACTN|nr:hypothetical protein LRS13_00645 [Parviterribacteraceae bacterium J379]
MAVDAELLGEHALGRQRVTRGQLGAQDLAAQVVMDLVGAQRAAGRRRSVRH